MSSVRPPSSWRWLAAAVALITALGLPLLTGGPAAASPRPPAAGAQRTDDTLLPEYGNGGYDVQHYRIKLAYRGDGSITATTRLRARAVHALSSFSLDLEGLTVNAVTVNGRTAAFSRAGHKLVVTPSRPVRGTFTTTVSYAGTPRPHIDPDGSKDGWIPTATGATTLNEPVGAMTWFPNNNTPRDKATFDLAVTVPASLEVAGSGDLISRRVHGKTATWTWSQTKPMAPYLSMLSIAEYEVFTSTLRTTSGRRLPVWSFVQPDLVAKTAPLQALIPEVVRAQERRSGRYPFTSVGIVVANVGSGYALETQNRPVFDGVPDTDTLVHELVHQWYGNSVTPKDWGDIWLNEGFASYGEWQWNATHGGPTTAAAFQSAYDAAGPGSSLWSPAPTRLTNPADLFSARVYERGRMTLEALRQRVGDRDFEVILRRWATEHRYGTVRTAQFTQLAERVSGEDLDAFFEAWLRTPAKPDRP